jgi:hypothetical protein
MEGSMNKQTTAAAPALKLGQKVTWKSGAKGSITTKTGKVVGIVKAGATPNAKKFKGLRFGGKARKITSYIVDVNGKPYFPHTSLLHKA